MRKVLRGYAKDKNGNLALLLALVRRQSISDLGLAI
jgi:hypothetical protein